MDSQGTAPRIMQSECGQRAKEKTSWVGVGEAEVLMGELMQNAAYNSTVPFPSMLVVQKEAPQKMQGSLLLRKRHAPSSMGHR